MVTSLINDTKMEGTAKKRETKNITYGKVASKLTKKGNPFASEAVYTRNFFFDRLSDSV